MSNNAIPPVMLRPVVLDAGRMARAAGVHTTGDTPPNQPPAQPDPADVRAAVAAFRLVVGEVGAIRPALKTITWGNDHGVFAAIAKIRADMQAAIGSWSRLMPKGAKQFDRLQTALGRLYYWQGAIEQVVRGKGSPWDPVPINFARLLSEFDDLATQASYAAVSIENSYGTLLSGNRSKGTR
ncbi:MAG: hypothetical protein H7123_02675 [Thermoleophilia bacterium]|nr:hypothetical protein [Thermoleophilia bacterium]